jgi:NTP pyrophosphatase (non-canonical NTP hydrolase)
MNRLEELLIILSEECAEVQQAAIKCVRFGKASTHPDSSESNQLKLEREIGDFMAMVRLLTEEYNLNMDNIIESADAKLIKVEKFMKNKKGLTAPELAEAFSHRTLPPLSTSVEKPHRRNPRRKTR